MGRGASSSRFPIYVGRRLRMTVRIVTSGPSGTSGRITSVISVTVQSGPPTDSGGERVSPISGY